jgi:peptide/nickel transport system permease protein
MTDRTDHTSFGAGAMPRTTTLSPALKSWRNAWQRFRRNHLAVVGLALILLTVAMAALAPVVAPSGPFEIVGGRLSPPSWQHLLGTDHLGRDIFSGVLYGARTSFLVGVLSTMLSLSLGIVVGAVAGFFGGRTDDLLMRITEIFQVMPRFFLALFMVAIFGANIWGIIFVIGILNWAEIARLLRAEFLTLKERPFVIAARAYGASNLTIIAREILPNALSPIIVAGALQIASAVLLEASLSFLGVGDPNVMSWGTMLNSAQQYLRYAWWTATFPGIAICLLTLGVALAADGMNDAFNPRLKELGRG